MRKEVAEVRAALLEFRHEAVAQLQRLVTSADPELAVEGLKLYFKHALPQWKEEADDEAKRMSDAELREKAREILRNANVPAGEALQ